jgi:hypothetical protein
MDYPNLRLVRSAGWTIAVMALVWVLCFVPTPAHADGAMRVLDCGKSVCVVVKSDLEALLESNNDNFDRAEKAEAELKKLREIKGCAKLEVTEPPRFVPKKERDS